MSRLINVTGNIPKLFPTNSLVTGHSHISLRFYSGPHKEESFEEFTDRYVKFFDNVDDRFELQRGLNNCFAHDIVPAPSVIEASLKAARRVNDYSTAVRIFEGIKHKIDNENTYNQYLDELKPIKEELGIMTKEELGI
ncbi:11575_t:CDS:2 [Acaulospora colombiana]|uniref:11575_t:CDS:1 n=1 Tax=Acaulospora colombiana TaxID=27376 RepID=A0ACA9LDE5_9GLOM|nr:11575_t:CDS:2 [Acaulospora colombiana]